MKTHELLVSSVGLLLLVAPASADPIFNAFGPGDSYYDAAGYIIGGDDRFDQGNQFSFAGTRSYRFDSIEVAVLHQYPGSVLVGPDAIEFWLMSDIDDRPGVVLESIPFIGMMETTSKILLGTSVLNPVLTPDTKYWLIASAPDNSTEAGWNISQPPIYGLRAIRSGEEAPWFVEGETIAAFRINGTPVAIPAPGAILLGTLGMGLVGWTRRRRTP